MANIRKSAKRAKKTVRRAGGKAKLLATKVAGKLRKRRKAKGKKVAAVAAGVAAATVATALMRKRKRARS
jgi:putative intracellular protease/amidase